VKDWMKAAAPIALAAVLVVVTLAASRQAPGAAAECMGDQPESIGMSGSTSSTSTYQFEFCSDPTLDLQVLVNWGNVKKDLGLRVTEPNGTQHWIDHQDTLTESYFQPAPLPEGSWTVEVVNMSSGMVKYSQSITVD